MQLCRTEKPDVLVLDDVMVTPRDVDILDALKLLQKGKLTHLAISVTHPLCVPWIEDSGVTSIEIKVLSNYADTMSQSRICNLNLKYTYPFQLEKKDLFPDFSNNTHGDGLLLALSPPQSPWHLSCSHSTRFRYAVGWLVLLCRRHKEYKMEHVCGDALVTLLIPACKGLSARKWAMRMLDDEAERVGGSANNPLIDETIHRIKDALPPFMPEKGLLVHAGFDDCNVWHLEMHEPIDHAEWTVAVMDARFFMTSYGTPCDSDMMVME
jgi:hypothetical protein